MKSSNSQVSLGFSLSVRKTRKAIFLEQMDRVVPWSRLVDLIAPQYPAGRTGRPPFELDTMLRTHFLQQWFNLSDPAMEEAFFDTPLYREFVGLADNVRLPDESTILRFRHRLEKHGLAAKILAEVNTVLGERGLMLKEGSAVDATLIAAPSSTKNKDKARDPEMYSSQKGNQWYFGSATCKSHVFLFHRRAYELMKPVVPPTVPYLDMRCWQRRGVKLQGQRTLRMIRDVKPRGTTNSASATAERGQG